MGKSLTAGIGAMQDIKSINLEEKIKLNQAIKTKSKVAEERSIKRLKLIESFRNGNKPEWMILTTVPVIPPEQDH